MSRPAMRGLLYVVLVLAFVLHNDLWLWDDARLTLGLPVGLVYHIGFCLAVALLMGLLLQLDRTDAPGDQSQR